MKRQTLCIGNKTAKLPLIQGGMGVGVSLSGLAGAVAKEGGIGIISTAQIGYREPDFEQDPKKANLRTLRAELKKARAIAKKPTVPVTVFWVSISWWPQEIMRTMYGQRQRQALT